MKSYIDLHLHTLFSDGEDSTNSLLDNVIENNVKFFSISDHDTIKGNLDFIKEENLNKLKQNNIKYITGIEVSSICLNRRIHILGYGYDISSPYIISLADKCEDLRKTKTLKRIEHIKNELGIKLSQKSIDYLVNLTVCAKPHFAKCFVDEGYSSDIQTALSTMVKDLPNIPCLVDADETISYLLNANATPVWAHPLGGINEKRLTKEEFLQVLEKLISYGLKGLECYYSLYTREEINFLVETAKKYNLLISCGSDYHGKNVKKVKIGEVSGDNVDINYDDISIIKLFNK